MTIHWNTRHSTVHAPSKKMGKFAVRPLCALLSALLAAPTAFSGPIDLAQVPAGNAGREPAPNLIITVDDSGSMGSEVPGGGTRIQALRNALTTSFSPTKVADDSIRLGFQAMWRCRGFPESRTNDYGGDCPENRVRSFSGAHRTGFNNWVNSLIAYGWTPSHLLMRQAGEFMKTTGTWSPYAHNPGVTETPLLSCRKSFHIFMTDGEWNSTNGSNRDAGTDGYGNQDGTNRTLPDGTAYNTDADNTQTRVYRDSFGGGVQYNTFSDLAFHYWATDLQPAINNDLRPIIRQSGSVDAGTVGQPYLIEEYWNPRNNPAIWQNLTTYTIGFGPGAALSATTAPRWGGGTWTGADYNQLLRGGVTWGNPGNPNTYGDAKQKDLWHAALNSRGRYVPATDTAELEAAFSEIINQVIADSSAPTASIAANTQSVTTATTVFVAGYNADKWKGSISAHTLAANKSLNLASWNAAEKLDTSTITPANRVVLSSNGTSGISFDWDNFSTNQKTAIRGADSDGNDDAIAKSRIAYLRGDRTKEQSANGNLRNRNSRLGDIVNSNIWITSQPKLLYSNDDYSTFKATYSGRAEMLYVGANDGMLHGFSTADGAEKIAYIPLGVYSKLREYSEPSYNSSHKYYVDGSPFTGDFYTGSTWKTALVGVLGGGGKGYFVLDVTDPTGFTATNASSLVLMDTTATTDPDIGHIYSEPVVDAGNAARTLQISKLNTNGRWALIMGNGVNSTNERSVLLIQYLDGDKSLKKIVLKDTVTNTNNGLAAPQLIDIDGNGTIDVAYAGDLQGNFWKIDLSSNDADNWGSYYTAAGVPAPLFVAKDQSNTSQPITSIAQWAVHPKGGLMLSFGTGREYSVTDRTTTSEQTIYGIWDNMTITPKGSPKMTNGTVVANGRANLVAQTRTDIISGANSQTYEKTTTNAVTYTTEANTKRGWYFDLPNAGERVVANGGMLDSRLVYHRSRIPGSGSIETPNTETCTPNASSPTEYLSIFDIFNGAAPKKAIFDNNGGGFTGTETVGLSRWKSGKEDRLMLTTSPGRRVSIGAFPVELGSGSVVSELGWRQLQ